MAAHVQKVSTPRYSSIVFFSQTLHAVYQYRAHQSLNMCIWWVLADMHLFLIVPGLVCVQISPSKPSSLPFQADVCLYIYNVLCVCSIRML